MRSSLLLSTVLLCGVTSLLSACSPSGAVPSPAGGGVYQQAGPQPSESHCYPNRPQRGGCAEGYQLAGHANVQLCIPQGCPVPETPEGTLGPHGR